MPPFVGAAVNVTLAPLQIVVPAEEEMETVGVVVAPTVTVNVCAMLVPHVLCAETPIFPEELPVVTVMELVVDVPDHPEGNVQM